MVASRDTLYAKTLADPGLFTFNADVVGVFPDMIRRSVPGYATVLAMTGLLAARHARPGTRLYDLGCSLGASLQAAAQHRETIDCELVGIDSSEAMISGCRQHFDSHYPEREVHLFHSDITEWEYSNASVCILNYTLQFVAPDKRLALLQNLRRALQPGDILLLSEKIRLTPEAMDQQMIALHHEFKRAQGYSDLEIAQKRQALENVLIPETLAEHKERLAQAGFSQCDSWFQCFNFASLIAIA